ncbi:MAG: phospholipase D family protein [Paraburkholderia sp.]|uniref:phospholipase D family nuclease n=1 Tax=Burkholderiaceae TaxID=119060 RepID=UPI0020183A2F|nr:phospholipase D family protein [Burkholderia sp. 4M9327F10]
MSLKTRIIAATLAASVVVAACLACAQPSSAAETASVEVAFSPDGGAEQLVLRAINGAQRSIRVLAYSFTAAPVVRALVEAKRRGVDVAVTVDYHENIEADRSGRARAALSALTYAGIPVRTVSAFPIMHSKVVQIDSATVVTGSYNLTAQAAHYNSENAVLITGSPAIAGQYLRNWNEVSALGTLYRAP